MSFSHLEEGIYQAGVAAGVYLSRYQRPINAVPGLRAKPVWEVKETGLKKALDKIRENWKVIRDEGLELMKQRRKWRVDPGWVGLPDSRCVCNDFFLTSVCNFYLSGAGGGKLQSRVLLFTQLQNSQTFARMLSSPAGMSIVLRIVCEDDILE